MVSSIQRLGYRPPATYQLDLEAYTVADLRQRGSKEKVRTTHRYEFHMLVCVTHGVCTQIVDFKPISCGSGSLLYLRPGQAHNFGRDETWNGWIVLYRSEFVLPASTALNSLKLAIDLERLPEHIVLKGSELRTVTGSIEQMCEDTKLAGPPDDINALLRHELHVLLSRLIILRGREQAPEPVNTQALRRFKRFQQLLEKRFAQWHQVADYARELGYSEKSLARAVTASMGTSAKGFIVARIILEAKRLLVHTDLPVGSIAEKLGFHEATNFSKFFRREVDFTPAEFRRRQLAVSP